MSDKKTLALAKQREHIVAQIAYERALISQNANSLRRMGRVVDKGKQSVRYLQKHPEIMLLPAAMLLVFKPRRLLTWAASGVGTWRMLQVWRNRLQNIK